jgi:hypothetical protein
MHVDSSEFSSSHEIIVTDDVRSYVMERDCDFRVCTSCGGPILLQASVKPPKSTDLMIPVGDHTIYVSMYQARYLDRIDMSMLPRFCEYF